MGGTDDDMLWNGSVKDGNVSSMCEEGEYVVCPKSKCTDFPMYELAT